MRVTMRQRVMIVVILAGALLALASSRDALAYVPRLSFEEMARRSRLAVTGEVIELRSYRAPFQDAGEVMFTDVTIRIQSVLKGTPETDEVTVQVLGGRIGSAFQYCLESPRYEKGEKVLVFLRDLNGKLWNTGWLQGKYTIAADGATVKGKERFPIERDVTLETVRGLLGSIPPSVAPTAPTPTDPAPAPAPPAGTAPRVEESGNGGVR
jgi:hypothetical protein